MNKPIKKKVGVIISNPIDHEIPLFQNLSLYDNLDVTVIFLEREGIKNFNAFGLKNITYGVDVLQGYNYTFLKNISPFKSLRWKYINPSVIKYLHKHKFDVVISYGYNSITTLLALFVCNKMNVPILLRTEAESVQKTSMFKRLVRKIILPTIYKKYNGFLSICKANADHYIKYHVPPGLIWNVPQTILFKNFFLAPDLPSDIRKLFNIPESSILFVFGSKLRDEKRPKDVVRAFCNLNSDIKAHLLVLSDGPLRKKCESIVRKANMNSQVTFTGYLEFHLLTQIYQASDVLIASSSETVGSVLYQGLAAGLAIISSDKIAGWYDIIQPGKNGMIYKYKDINALTASIETMAINVNLIKLMKKTSKDFAENFNPIYTAGKFANVLTSIGT